MNDTIRTPGRLTTVGPACKKLNPQVFGPVKESPYRDGDWLSPDSEAHLGLNKAKPKKRLRQSSKPLMNKLEAEWHRVLLAEQELAHCGNIRPQAKRYKLGNGIWFKPDFTGTMDAKETAWEVKGPHAFRGGFENLKVAAHLWPEVRWILVWKDNGQWQTQDVKG